VGVRAAVGLSLLCACASGAATITAPAMVVRVAKPAPHPPRVPNPPPPSLTDALGVAGTFHLLRLDASGAPRCEVWELTPTADGALFHSSELSMDLDVSDRELSVSKLERLGTPYWSTWRTSFSAHVRDDGAIQVGTAIWFRDAASCHAALAAEEPVAFYLHHGELVIWDWNALYERSETLLRTRMRTGGFLWTIEDGACVSWKVRKARRVRGELQTIVRRGDAVIDISMDRDGAGGWFRQYESGGASGGAFSYPYALTPSVLIQERMYFDEASCGATIEYERTVARWTAGD
jgi:hypothetical protein